MFTCPASQICKEGLRILLHESGLLCRQVFLTSSMSKHAPSAFCNLWKLLLRQAVVPYQGHRGLQAKHKSSWCSRGPFMGVSREAIKKQSFKDSFSKRQPSSSCRCHINCERKPASPVQPERRDGHDTAESWLICKTTAIEG